MVSLLIFELKIEPSYLLQYYFCDGKLCKYQKVRDYSHYYFESAIVSQTATLYVGSFDGESKVLVRSEVSVELLGRS